MHPTKLTLHFEPADVPNFDDTGLFTIEEKMLERIANEDFSEIDGCNPSDQSRGKAAS